MNTEDVKSPPWREKLRKALPGVLVLVTVLVLVQGVRGAAAVLWRQLTTLVESVFGGADALTVVLLHTAPLALSAGIAAFAVGRRWLTFESAQSVLALTLMVLAGASLGGTLRDLAPPVASADPIGAPRLDDEPVEPSRSARLTERSQDRRSTITVQPLRVGQAIPLSIRADGKNAKNLADATGTPLPAAPSPWRRLSKTRWLAPPDLRG